MRCAAISLSFNVDTDMLFKVEVPISVALDQSKSPLHYCTICALSVRHHRPVSYVQYWRIPRNQLTCRVLVNFAPYENSKVCESIAGLLTHRRMMLTARLRQKCKILVNIYSGTCTVRATYTSCLSAALSFHRFRSGITHLL